MLKLVHMMGGSVKNYTGERMTHLVAVSAVGEKYQYANTFNVPIVRQVFYIK